MVEREDALSALRAFIVAGKYNPGDRLPPERELMVSLDMSRSRLRRALEALELRGERSGATWARARSSPRRAPGAWRS